MVRKFDLIPINKVRDIVARILYHKEYHELCNMRQLIIEQIIREEQNGKEIATE